MTATPFKTSATHFVHLLSPHALGMTSRSETAREMERVHSNSSADFLPLALLCQPAEEEDPNKEMDSYERREGGGRRRSSEEDPASRSTGIRGWTWGRSGGSPSPFPIISSRMGKLETRGPYARGCTLTRERRRRTLSFQRSSVSSFLIVSGGLE